MEILRDILELSVVVRIIKERTGQDVKIRLKCSDPTGFLEVDGGMWRDMNEDILESDLIVDLEGSDASSISVEECPFRITRNEWKYFEIGLIETEGV